MKYKNPNMKKVRNSFNLIVSCGFCGTDLVRYQKRGKGGLLNMRIDRIIEAEQDLYNEKAFKCMNCDELLGVRVLSRKSNMYAFKMLRSKSHTRVEQ